MDDRVARHFGRFNEAVRCKDWTAFVAAFTPDAVMTFHGVPAGPYAGREEIARACAAQPPSDTMTCVSVQTQGERDTVRFAWDAGGAGTLVLDWRDGLIAGLSVSFG